MTLSEVALVETWRAISPCLTGQGLLHHAGKSPRKRKVRWILRSLYDAIMICATIKIRYTLDAR
jgi:hypothetical protein